MHAKGATLNGTGDIKCYQHCPNQDSNEKSTLSPNEGVIQQSSSPVAKFDDLEVIKTTASEVKESNSISKAEDAAEILNESADSSVVSASNNSHSGTASAWLIAVAATAIFLFFLCLAVCVIRGDHRLISDKECDSERKKKSPTKTKQGKKYELCDDTLDEDEEYDAGTSDDGYL